MNLEKIHDLVKWRVIEDYFDYQGLCLDAEQLRRYKYCEDKFEALFTDKAIQYKLRDYHFVINNDWACNAFARRNKGYNIIGITCAYPIIMSDIFDEKYFSSLILIGLMNDVSMSNAYADLYNLERFQLNKFMLDCSIQFTFGHEFQHILQFSSSKSTINHYKSENLDKSEFKMKDHAWEFDADRFAAFEVLKYIFEIKREHQVKDDKIFFCMLYLGLGSIFITKVFFYLGLEDPTQKIGKIEFYTKKHSHPHPIIRLCNITDYFYDNVKDFFPKLIVDQQDFLNNAFGLIKIYFNSYLPKSKVIDEIFKDLDLHLDTIYSYNEELFDYAINDQSIRNLLTMRGINFE